MIKDLYDVLKDSMGNQQTISEELIVELIGLYGLTRLNNAGVLEGHNLSNGDKIYSLSDIVGGNNGKCISINRMG